jgi:hypothetical protein
MVLYRLPNSLQQAELTQAIMRMPVSFNHLGRLGLFTNIHVETRDIAFEYGDGALSFVPASEPCGNPNTIHNIIGNDGGEPILIRAPHHEIIEAVNVCNIAGIRQWNSDAWESVEGQMNQRLVHARASFDYTIEVLQLNALLGEYYNSAGQFIGLNTKFDSAPSTDAHPLAPATNLNEFFNGISQKQNKILKKTGKFARQWLVLASDGWWNKFNALDYFSKQKTGCCNETGAAADIFGASRKFENYTVVNFNGEGLANIPANKAIFVPVGVPDLFVTYWTPANTMRTINRMSPKLTVQTGLLDWEEGVVAKIHMDPLSVNKVPEAVLIHDAA